MPADSFLSRWSKRKQESRSAEARPTTPPSEKDTAPARSTLVPPPAEETPTDVPVESAQAVEKTPESADKAELPPVESLTPESDFRPFMQPDVDPAVRNHAMKSLFRDPHFNVMDMMDVYVDDYSQPDPIPADMLRQMTQSRLLKLFDDLPEEASRDEKADPRDSRSPDAPSPAAAGDPVSPLVPEATAEVGQKVTDTTNCLTPTSGSENETQHGAS